jgi:hypothetical protein
MTLSVATLSIMKGSTANLSLNPTQHNFMLRVMLIIDMLSVVVLSVVMLNVAALSEMGGVHAVCRN